MGDRTCTFPDCQRRLLARGMCSLHYQRWQCANRGAPSLQRWRWTGDRATYNAVHLRIKKARGSATCYDCQHCGQRASEWAYDHRDPNARTDQTNSLIYSVDVWHYLSLCHPCHFRLDADHGYLRRKTCPNGHDYVTYMTIVGKNRVRRCGRCHAERANARYHRRSST